VRDAENLPGSEIYSPLKRPPASLNQSRGFENYKVGKELDKLEHRNIIE
jgi:hypothetical protein